MYESCNLWIAISFNQELGRLSQVVANIYEFLHKYKVVGGGGLHLLQFKLCIYEHEANFTGFSNKTQASIKPTFFPCHHYCHYHHYEIQYQANREVLPSSSPSSSWPSYRKPTQVKLGSHLALPSKPVLSVRFSWWDHHPRRRIFALQYNRKHEQKLHTFKRYIIITYFFLHVNINCKILRTLARRYNFANKIIYQTLQQMYIL